MYTLGDSDIVLHKYMQIFKHRGGDESNMPECYAKHIYMYHQVVNCCACGGEGIVDSMEYHEGDIQRRRGYYHKTESVCNEWELLLWNMKG
jgi:hypothetical protein